MITFNDEYNAEIVKIIIENPKAYGKMLKSKGFLGRYPDRSYLYDYVMASTPELNDPDFQYSFKTRVFWTVNKIENWENPLVCCQVCGKPLKHWNLSKFKDGYKATCGITCERIVASATNKETCLAKYGVTNVFASKAVREDLNGRKDEIYKKREENARKNHGCKVWNNAEKAMKTKIEKYGSVWHLEKCRESMVEKYGAPNPMQVASIQKRQQRAAYIMDGIKFDSSWEVYMYIWLRDTGIEFEYHPSSPEFWYEKADGSRHRYYPDFILKNTSEIWEPKGDNSFDEDGNPLKNGWFDWKEKYEYMKSIGVRLFLKEDIQPFQDYVERKYGVNFTDSLIDDVP